MDFAAGTATHGDFHKVTQPGTSLYQDIQPGHQKLFIINRYATTMSNPCPPLPSLHPGRNQESWLDLFLHPPAKLWVPGYVGGITQIYGPRCQHRAQHTAGWYPCTQHVEPWLSETFLTISPISRHQNPKGVGQVLVFSFQEHF